MRSRRRAHFRHHQQRYELHARARTQHSHRVPHSSFSHGLARTAGSNRSRLNASLSWL
jgi:hypothetical protein